MTTHPFITLGPGAYVQTSNKMLNTLNFHDRFVRNQVWWRNNWICLQSTQSSFCLFNHKACMWNKSGEQISLYGTIYPFYLDKLSWSNTSCQWKQTYKTMPTKVVFFVGNSKTSKKTAHLPMRRKLVRVKEEVKALLSGNCFLKLLSSSRKQFNVFTD